MLRYLINHACLLADCQMRKAEWQTKRIHLSLRTEKYLKYILTYSSAYSKREILRVLEENSARISKNGNTATLYCT